VIFFNFPFGGGVIAQRESIAYPYMDFNNLRLSIWISMIIGCQSIIIHTKGDILINP